MEITIDDESSCNGDGNGAEEPMGPTRPPGRVAGGAGAWGSAPASAPSGEGPRALCTHMCPPRAPAAAGTETGPKERSAHVRKRAPSLTTCGAALPQECAVCSASVHEHLLPIMQHESRVTGLVKYKLAEKCALSHAMGHALTKHGTSSCPV